MRYFEEDYAPGWSYFAGDAGRVVGEWSGGAAGRLGLAGRPVTRGNFHSLAEGVAPDGTPLVRHPGGEGRLAHRAGWDVLTGAPKSVSAAAIGGRDGRPGGPRSGRLRGTTAAADPARRARIGDSARRCARSGAGNDER